MQNKPVTARQNLILEPKENAIQMTLNLIYSIRIPRKQQMSVYRSFYYVTQTLCMISLRQK
jgi:hypothetical protein